MKLKEYAESINKLLNEYPDAEVVYSIDNEGNYFHKVVYQPMIGHFSKGKFVYREQIEKRQKVNAVCIN